MPALGDSNALLQRLHLKLHILHTAPFTLHTLRLRFAFHPISSHLSSSCLISALLISSLLIYHLCSSQLFSFHLSTAHPFSFLLNTSQLLCASESSDREKRISCAQAPKSCCPQKALIMRTFCTEPVLTRSKLCYTQKSAHTASFYRHIFLRREDFLYM